MALTGYLSDYSLAEVLQFIQQGNKTGLLTITPKNQDAGEQISMNYTWFQNGRVVANAKELNSLGLIAMLEKRNWIGTEVSENLRSQLDTLSRPLGLHLKLIDILDVEQLRILFHAQVLQAVCALFKLPDAQFYFDESISISNIKPEMTGMSVSAVEASLLGLRVLKDWTYLERKLPVPEFGLQRLSTILPEFKLDTQEMRMLEIADGRLNITQIAKDLEMTVLKAQQIAFRLTSVGLVKEIALDFKPIMIVEKGKEISVVEPPAETAKPAVSKSFLNNLVGFLRKQK
jgi:Domain of unknown function (DUF4388)